MKFLSVSTKLNIAIIGISLASLVTSFFVLSWYAEQIKQDIYKNTAKELIESSDEKINFKMRIGLTNAIAIANDQRLKSALQTEQQKDAVRSLEEITDTLQKHTEFKDVQIQLYTKDNTPFLKTVKTEEDASGSSRASLVSVQTTLAPIVSFESYQSALLLRAITPLITDKAQYLGSLEFIQELSSVAKYFDETGTGFLLLMDAPTSDNNKKFQDYTISQKFLNQDFLKSAKSIDIKQLLKNRYLLDTKYFYTYAKVKNFQNKELGIILLAKPLFLVNSVIDKSQLLIYISLFGILVMALVTTFVVVLAVRILITKPLKIFEENLLNFFLFLQGKTDHRHCIEIVTDDEFGKMANSLRENMAVSAKLHEDIYHLNENLEHEVDEKTKEIAALLNNAGQGFLSFGCDFIVDDEYSAECHRLLGKKIAGSDIVDLLFSDPTKKLFFKSTILDIKEISDYTIKKSLLSLLPIEVILNKRALKLEYKLFGESKLMLIITNVTAQKKLESKIKKEQETLKMIVEIVTQGDTFFDTKTDYEEFIHTYEKYIDKDREALHNINDIYMYIHTFKGSFSQLYVNNVVSFLHSIENSLSEMIKEEDPSNEKLLSFLHTTDFDSNIQKELKIIKNILGEEFFHSNHFVKIELSVIKGLERKIHTLFQEAHLDTSEAKKIMMQISDLSKQKLYYLLKHYPSLVEDLAHRLKKDVYPFEISGEQTVAVADEVKPFLKTLIHVFRNAIDHGIETPKTRIKNSKKPKGTISCSFEQTDGIIKITISDDGAGIDKEKVLQKALKKKILSEEAIHSLSDDAVYELIFSKQFSTKDKATDISGRGVGMSAVKTELDKIGGSISIQTDKNRGTTFVFTIPKQEEKI
ncbi:hypothetical protein KJ691_05085 [bacterium]|nr:hypothetical protein [bacterium]